MAHHVLLTGAGPSYNWGGLLGCFVQERMTNYHVGPVFD
jgi:hypothetical protein